MKCEGFQNPMQMHSRRRMASWAETFASVAKRACALSMAAAISGLFRFSKPASVGCLVNDLGRAIPIDVIPSK